MKYRAIIFDLDDTLYPERSYVLSGFRAVAEYCSDKWDIPAATVFAELQTEFDGGNRTHTFDAWLSRQLLPTVTADELVDVYRSHVPLIELFEGMRALLATIAAESRIGLISDGYLNVQRLKFAALGVNELFDCVMFSDQWGRDHWKPSQRPYREALRALDVADTTKAVYIGDNPAKDFITPRAIGMHTIQARYSRNGIHNGRVAPSPEHEPHEIVVSVDDLWSSLR